MRTRAAHRIVETSHELHERRLAGPRLADQGNGLARRDVHVDTGDRLFAGRARVAEVDVVEADIAMHLVEHDRVVDRRRAARRVEQLVDLVQRGGSLLPCVEHLRQLLDR